MHLPQEFYQIYHSSNLVPESGLFIDTWDMPQRSIHSGWGAVCIGCAVKRMVEGFETAFACITRVDKTAFTIKATHWQSLSAFCVVSCFPPKLSEFGHCHPSCVSPPHAFLLSPSLAIFSWHTPTYTHFVSLKWCSLLLAVIKSKVGCIRVCLKVAQDARVPSLREP